MCILLFVLHYNSVNNVINIKMGILDMDEFSRRGLDKNLILKAKGKHIFIRYAYRKCV